MTALVILALAGLMQAPNSDPAGLGDDAREIFRLERQSAAGRAEPSPGNPAAAKIGGRQDAGPAPSNAFDPIAADALRNDAWLHDVCFSDTEQGWAVGDRGAIWHSGDGGRNWQLQDSGVACPLWSVCFINAQTGWAAGGFSHPFLHSSAGVLLATRDGGRHWYHDPKLLLPALKRIHFFDAKHGWAAGDSSPLFPAGVFASRDGGRTWMPLGGGSAAGWTAGDFSDAQTGILAGRNGAVAAVRYGEPASAPAAGLDLQTLRQLRLPAPPFAWLAGDGGTVLFTADLGEHWRAPPALPRDTAALLDFAALAVRGPKCWIAGTPGSRVLHSPDGGRTWSVVPTPTTLPLDALCFPDDRHGWAVGAMGTILASDDGGRSWRRQRAGGARAALLGLFCHEDDVPLELLARLAGNEGYLSVVDVLGRRDLEVADDEAHRDDRIRQAVVAVGGCGAETAWQFPLRQAGLQLSAPQVIECWDRFHGGRGLQDLEAHLVRQIRLWRREIVVTQCAAAAGDDAAQQLVAQTVAGAIGKAADPRAFPAQTTLAGLDPWQVKRAYGSLSPGNRGTIDLMTSQLAPRLGRSLADVAAPARSLLVDRFQPPADLLGFRPLAEAGLPGQGGGDFFAGATLPPGGEARRQLTDASAEGVELLQQMAKRRRHVQAVLDQADRDPQAALRLLAQIGELTRGLDPASAAEARSIGWPTATRGRATATWRPKLFRCWWTNIRTIRFAGRRWFGWCSITPAASRPSAPRRPGAGRRRQSSGPAGSGGGAGPANRADAARSVRFSAAAFLGGRRLSQTGPAATGSAFVRRADPRTERGCLVGLRPGRTLVAPAQRPLAQADAVLRDGPGQAAIDGPAGRRPLAAGQGGHAAEQPARRFALAGHGHARPRCRVPLHWHSLSPGRRGPL